MQNFDVQKALYLNCEIYCHWFRSSGPLGENTVKLYQNLKHLL